MARLPDHILAAVRDALDVQNELTVGHIQVARLTGKGPFPVDQGKLGVRTGRLRQSFRPSKARIVGRAVASAIGTNVIYMGPHEFGLTGIVEVKAHVRTPAKRKPHEVRAHTRNVNVPSRSPIRKGIADRAGAYGTAVSAAIRKSWGGKS